jgi:hypothetical protein
MVAPPPLNPPAAPENIEGLAPFSACRGPSDPNIIPLVSRGMGRKPEFMFLIVYSGENNGW